MLLMLSVAVPVFVKVAVCAVLVVFTSWLAKAKVAGCKLAAGAIPVPERLMGFTLLLLVSDKVPLPFPVAEGVKVTAIVQLALGFNALPQLLVCTKSPVVAIVVIARGPSPLLVSVTPWLALATPSSWFAKLRLAGDQLALGAVALPESVAEGAAPVKSPDTVIVPFLAP
jgi:hypothetical protein